jgi:predicted ATPase
MDEPEVLWPDGMGPMEQQTVETRASITRLPLRLTHVTLENWRNFTRVDVDIARRSFLVGPNASGKSNFLDAIRFLRDVSSVGGGLLAAVQQRGGVSRLRSLAARQNPDVAIRVAIGRDDAVDLWRYELAFGQEGKHELIIKRELVVHEGVTLVERPDADDVADPERRTQTYLEQVNVNRPFRDLASFFAGVRYLHLVPQLVREPDRSVGRANDPFGGDFLQQLASTPANTREARLRRITRALRFAVPQLVELKLDRDKRGTPHLVGRYEHWRPRGAWQNETQFSDGTLRLVGLLWALLDGTSPLLLEEPELSLHPDVVRQIPAMFARVQRRSSRQVLVSTHSSDLLRDDGVGLDEVLILRPDLEGTTIRSAAGFAEIEALLRGGLTMADAVLPWTRPRGAEQLPLFAE